MDDDDPFAVPASLLPDAEAETRLGIPDDVDGRSISCSAILRSDRDGNSDGDLEVDGGGPPLMAAYSSGSSTNDHVGIDDSDSDDVGKSLTLNPLNFVDPASHISNQFFTFTRDSYSLMVRCILNRRLATRDEICGATPPSVLASWRNVWKDRNVATAYITGWKRIQEKLNAHVDDSGHEFLFFKNNPQQYVSHVGQWQEILSSFHGDADLKHLGLKETIERIKQVWTVGAKFYGIPETFIRCCVSSCSICPDASGSSGRNKRRRFEYTESFEVLAKEVPNRLQQLAAKHKVVLCIRQKYIRYKPFMAEVKDYACHRAGDPNEKRSRVLKREPFSSKRCGCGFRIRAIVPITNYNEKEKNFVYDEEGMAVFKLYAVHSGHDPGPTDGSGRSIQTTAIDRKDVGIEFFDVIAGTDDPDASSRISVLKQVQNLQMEIGELESKVGNMPEDMLSSLSQTLSAIIHRIRSIGKDEAEMLLQKEPHNVVSLLGGGHHSGLVGDWNGHQQMHGEDELIDGEDTAEDFERSLESVSQWDSLSAECRSKSILGENCKQDKWLDSVKEACGEYDEKGILVCEDTKLVKPVRQEGALMADSTLVGIQTDGFYPENPKWFDSPCTLDPGSDCGDDTFSDGRIM